MTPIARVFFSLAIGVVFLGEFSAARAAIVLQGTRVVFAASVREETVQIKNESDAPVLVQSWVDDGRVDVPPEQMKVPFVVAPAVGRVESGQGAVLRISYTQEALPTDRESLFWLNVMEVPPRQASAENVLQFAFRTRIKLFFRPSHLPSNVDSAAQQLTWKVRTDTATGSPAKLTLLVSNPSAYYVSLGDVKLSFKEKLMTVGPRTVAPFSSELFILPRATAAEFMHASVRYEVINDYGGRRMLQKPLAE
ncbi:fimbria/pilus periplasmic chaperone [Pseudomonas sp. TH34]|uniref:fimbrial biogenesis chaperone n=1 Tax=Pseudomonas sp. TH34 TaxID=2796399 RepID=UPI001913F49E|nr:fimbria/pilus periplasmic chaperone [Pseudomonas sp. TH34]MBK5408904.1 fimbria/pilus periplasmic chaperone [Pseudomonas sp. TH34]